MEPRLKDLDDASLVAAVGRSDEQALQELYERHSAAVYGLARRVLVDADRAEEVVQEVFLRLWNEPERFDPTRGKLRSYLNRQAHSRAVERVRSEEARRRREERHDRENVDPAYDVEIEAWELIRSELVKEAIDAALRGRAAGDHPGLLRRPHLPGGGGDARPAGGHDQESHPPRPGQAG